MSRILSSAAIVEQVFPGIAVDHNGVTVAMTLQIRTTSFLRRQPSA
jgi:hypothetical protein